MAGHARVPMSMWETPALLSARAGLSRVMSPARQVVTSTRRRHVCVAAMRASVVLTVTLGRATLIHATMLAREAVVTIRTVATSVNAGLRTRDSSVTHLKVNAFIWIRLCNSV